MKRKGFTLIELLAVIVILAIIALIATPIVLNIIENTKEEANKRSIDMYVRGVKNSIAKYHLDYTKAPKEGNYTTEDGVTLTHETDPNVQLTVDYDGDVVCSTIRIYKNGSIYLADCKVNGVEVEYIYGTTESICELVDDADGDGEISPGDEYLCAVEEGMDLENDDGYTFYVLGNNLDGTTNLIMYANINEYGQPYDSNNVEGRSAAWSADNSTANGPVTALAYLDEATSSWKEELRLNETYTDENGLFTNFVLNGKARLPKLSEVSDYDGTNLYLYDYLDCMGEGPQLNEISGPLGSGPWGYWLLDTDGANDAWTVYSAGHLATTGFGVGYEQEIGIRPVITVQL